MAVASRAPERARRSDFESSRRRILAAAREVTAERGPEALTVSEVAHRAGLNRTTTYQHFRTRDDLVGAVMSVMVDDVTRMLLLPLPLEERIDHIAAFLHEHPEIARLTLHQLLTENPVPREGLDAVLGEVQRIATGPGAQPGVDHEMLAYMLICMSTLWPLVARALHDDEADARHATERLTQELKRLLLHGVLRPAEWPGLEASIDSAEKGRA